MAVVLYVLAVSHPSQAVRKMLDLKQVEYRLVDIPLGAQRVGLRLAGFRHGTVPALMLDGRRVQGSRAIARVLDERFPQAPLFPADPALRAPVEEAERWGEEQFQPIPRRLFRFLMADRADVRAWAMRSVGLPVVPPLDVAVKLSGAYFARTVEADGRRATAAVVRADLVALPGMLDRVDQLLTDGTLATEPPNAATLQILSTVAALCAFDDLSDLMNAHACVAPALALFGSPRQQIPRVLDPAWIP